MNTPTICNQTSNWKFYTLQGVSLFVGVSLVALAYLQHRGIISFKEINWSIKGINCCAVAGVGLIGIVGLRQIFRRYSSNQQPSNQSKEQAQAVSSLKNEKATSPKRSIRVKLLSGKFIEIPDCTPYETVSSFSKRAAALLSGSEEDTNQHVFIYAGRIVNTEENRDKSLGEIITDPNRFLEVRSW